MTATRFNDITAALYASFTASLAPLVVYDGQPDSSAPNTSFLVVAADVLPSQQSTEVSAGTIEQEYGGMGHGRQPRAETDSVFCIAVARDVTSLAARTAALAIVGQASDVVTADTSLGLTDVWNAITSAVHEIKTRNTSGGVLCIALFSVRAEARLL